ncbi:hypothetical protein [Rhizorhapis suberifaciens]|uniref:Uncharacterized protein n=1 Tax=Rhizorhapis suberifaciens TaxID=13656 RepID=A0A840HZE0_9SPHN|nr:hypothetical protein [Rhizorhapis suberifaciens]MBB4642878.1 hypothetical protein [Rhizorhapis suberifaciens]
MGSTNLQHSLRKKYSALTGELVEVRKAVTRIQRDHEKMPGLEERARKLEALIGAAAILLKDISPDWTPEQTAPVRPRTHTLPVPYGSCGRRAMDVLRRADKPMTVRQIAMEILREAKKDIPEPNVSYALASPIWKTALRLSVRAAAERRKCCISSYQ